MNASVLQMPGVDRPEPVTARDDVLVVDGLNVDFRARQDLVRVVDGVSFSIRRGETVALVGSRGPASR